jgi:hypothetical protein
MDHPLTPIHGFVPGELLWTHHQQGVWQMSNGSSVIARWWFLPGEAVAQTSQGNLTLVRRGWTGRSCHFVSTDDGEEIAVLQLSGYLSPRCRIETSRGGRFHATQAPWRFRCRLRDERGNLLLEQTRRWPFLRAGYRLTTHAEALSHSELPVLALATFFFSIFADHEWGAG